MSRKLVHFGQLLVLLGGCLVSSSFAATRVTSAVVPSVATADNQKVFIHTAVRNVSAAAEAVTVSIDVTNPGGCIYRENFQAMRGLRQSACVLEASKLGWLTSRLTFRRPPCSGTYTVTVTVKNSSGAVIASHTTKFTVDLPTP